MTVSEDAQLLWFEAEPSINKVIDDAHVPGYNIHSAGQ